MKTLNISKQVRITSLTPEDLNKIEIREGEAIHLSERIQEALQHKSTNEILENPGYVIINITENIGKFINKLLNQAPAHKLTEHLILIHESEKKIIEAIEEN